MTMVRREHCSVRGGIMRCDSCSVLWGCAVRKLVRRAYNDSDLLFNGEDNIDGRYQTVLDLSFMLGTDFFLDFRKYYLVLTS